MSFIQIASWNIEHLSGTSRGDDKQSAFALADHIEMAGVDIIALQEVYVTPTDEVVRIAEGGPPVPNRATSERRNADLDVVCYLLQEHMGSPWSYLILPNRRAGDTSQLCAVMWNTERARHTETLALDVSHNVDGDSLWDRKPHALKFTMDMKVWRKDANDDWQEEDVQKSLSLVPIHMKSNYGGVTENRRKRAREAKELCGQLDRIRNDLDPSIIVIGDTNILNNQEPAIERFVDNGLIDLNNNDSPTYWSRTYGDSPFDRAFVAADRAEFRYSRQYVLKSSDLVAHDRFLSDHFMIKMSVKAYLDDDDPRGGL